MFASYLVKAVDVFSGREMSDRQKMLSDLGGVGRLGVNTECIIDPNSRLGELDNRIAIFDESANAKLMNDKEE